MDIFNGIRMENRGGSEGRMAIARLDKVGLAAIYSPVCFAFKDVALFCIVGLPLHTHTHIRPDQFHLYGFDIISDGSVSFFHFYFIISLIFLLLKRNGTTREETIACRLSIQSRTRCLVLAIHPSK
jgi:hypothetical protein